MMQHSVVMFASQCFLGNQWVKLQTCVAVPTAIFAEMSMLNKRSRQDRTLTEKLKILQYVDENHKMKKQSIAEKLVQKQLVNLLCLKKFYHHWIANVFN